MNIEYGYLTSDISIKSKKWSKEEYNNIDVVGFINEK